MGFWQVWYVSMFRVDLEGWTLSQGHLELKGAHPDNNIWTLLVYLGLSMWEGYLELMGKHPDNKGLYWYI